MINAEAPLGLVVAPQVLLAGVTRLLHLRVVSVVPGPLLCLPLQRKSV